MTQLGALLTWVCLLTRGTCSRFLGMPEGLCWLYWRPALSLGEGLTERMMARSWLLLRVLPKAHRPLRNRKWHMTKTWLCPLGQLCQLGVCLPHLAREWYEWVLLNKLYSHLPANSARPSRVVKQGCVESGSSERPALQEKGGLPELMAPELPMASHHTDSNLSLPAALPVPLFSLIPSGFWLDFLVASHHLWLLWVMALLTKACMWEGQAMMGSAADILHTPPQLVKSQRESPLWGLHFFHGVYLVYCTVPWTSPHAQAVFAGV